MPVNEVWKAWTEPEYLMRWWGPATYTSTNWNIVFTEGGRYHACMRKPDGTDIWSTGIFTEIISPKKIVFTDCFADSKGNVVDPSYYGIHGMQPELLVTVEFEDISGKTGISLQHAGLPASMADNCIKGWQSSLDKLESNLK